MVVLEIIVDVWRSNKVHSGDVKHRRASLEKKIEILGEESVKLFKKNLGVFYSCCITRYFHNNKGSNERE